MDIWSSDGNLVLMICCETHSCFKSEIAPWTQWICCTDPALNLIMQDPTMTLMCSSDDHLVSIACHAMNFLRFHTSLIWPLTEVACGCKVSRSNIMFALLKLQCGIKFLFVLSMLWDHACWPQMSSCVQQQTNQVMTHMVNTMMNLQRPNEKIKKLMNFSNQETIKISHVLSMFWNHACWPPFHCHLCNNNKKQNKPRHHGPLHTVSSNLKKCMIFFMTTTMSLEENSWGKTDCVGWMHAKMKLVAAGCNQRIKQNPLHNKQK